MKVGNVCGHAYGVGYNGSDLRFKGKTIVIPSDRQLHDVPDDIDTSQFGNFIKIVVPPVKAPIIEDNKESKSAVISINIDDLDKKKFNYVELISESFKAKHPNLFGGAVKEEVKEEIIEDVKEEVVKEEAKEEVKEEIKEVKVKRTYNKKPKTDSPKVVKKKE